MELEYRNSDDLIDRVKWRPRYILNSMVAIRDAIKPTPLSSVPVPSHLGILNTLPPELLHIIFNSLDFRSLSRFTRVCRQGKATIESLPAYRDLIKHAFPALAALNRTELITFHTATSLHAALLSEKCVACDQFAAFLFLPTAERCCFECLHRDRSLRLITSGMARRFFGLTPKDLSQIPSLISIPGNYAVGNRIEYKKRTRLFSLKHSKALGITKHGSADAMNQFVTSQNAGKLTFRQRDEVRRLTGYPSIIGSNGSAPNDRFCGMASTVFPALQPNNVLETGLWCLGCRANCLNDRGHPTLDTALRSLVSSTRSSMPFFDLERRARSKSALLEHIRVCKGAKDLLRGLERGVEASKDFL